MNFPEKVLESLTGKSELVGTPFLLPGLVLIGSSCGLHQQVTRLDIQAETENVENRVVGHELEAHLGRNQDSAGDGLGKIGEAGLQVLG